VPRLLVSLTLLFCVLISGCAGGFDKSAGRAADNAAGALGLLWGPGKKKTVRSPSSSSSPSRNSSSKVRSRTKPSVGAVTPSSSSSDSDSDADEDEDEGSSLGGMERPGAR